MRKAAIALGLVGLAAAATTVSTARAPGAVVYAGWVTEGTDCSPGTHAGQAVERVSKVTVDGRALVAGLEPLRQGDRVKTSRRGKGLICLKRGGWECDVAADTSVRVLPRAQVVLELADGRVTCSTPATYTEQRVRAPGSTLLVGGRLRSSRIYSSGAIASGGGEVLSIGFVKGRTIVKVRRGASILASKQTVQNAVVIGRGEQAAVTLGRKPSAPTSITLTQDERATFAARERALPRETDRTAPHVTLRGPHDPSSVRSAQFSFGADEAATFSCALDNTDFRLCTSPFDIKRVGRGRHTFSLRATDAAGNTRPAQVSWTADGSRIVFESFRDGNPEIYTVDPDGENLVRVTTNTISDEHPDWSPGQARIAFDRLEGKNLDIYTVNADGSGLQRLTQDLAADRNPTWSPDGKMIAFESYRDGGNRDVYVMNADGSGQRRLTTDPAEDLDPAWAPDGRRLVFASTRDGNFEIYGMNVDGSGQTRLTNDLAPDFGPSWAPSTRIAFHSLRTRDYLNIFVMNPDGADVRPVTRTERNDANPSWAPDAVHIVFQSDRDPGAEAQLYIVDLETGAVTRMPMASTRANFVPDW
jgi:Tol biopolymer transport system component